MKSFSWNAGKNIELISGRGISFDEVVFYIENGGLIDDIVHPKVDKYPNQRIFIIAIFDYVYLVPYVENQNEIFMKTIIPSRKFTKRYMGDMS